MANRQPDHFETDLTRAVAAVWAALTTGQHSAAKTAGREAFPEILERLIGQDVTDAEIVAIVRATPTLKQKSARPETCTCGTPHRCKIACTCEGYPHDPDCHHGQGWGETE